MNKYNELIEKAPIICVGDKTVHLSDFVNDIRYNKNELFNKQSALDDIEVVIDYINKSREVLEILQNKDIQLDLLKASIKFGEEQGYYSYAKLWCMDSLYTFNQERYITQEEYNKIKEWLENE